MQKNSFLPLGFELEASNSCSLINPLFFSPTPEDSLLTSPLTPPGLGWFAMPGSELAQKLLQEKKNDSWQLITEKGPSNG